MYVHVNTIFLIKNLLDVIYFKRLLGECCGNPVKSVFSERTEDSSAVQYFQVYQ